MRSSTWTTVVLVRSSLNHLGHVGAFMSPLDIRLSRGVLQARYSVDHLCPNNGQMKRLTTLWSATTAGGDTNDSSSRTSCKHDTGVPSLPLPPTDDTYERFPLAILREGGLIPRPVNGSGRYDRIGKTTGGIWRTKLLGLTPITVVSPVLATPWLSRAEATGNVVQTWPESILELLGPKALSTLGDRTSIYNTLRGIYKEALSPKAVVEITPFVESCLTRRAQNWDQMAKKGEEVRIFDEIASFTMEVILHAFLGDYGTEEVLKDCLRLVPQVSKGMLSIPRRFWWPLDRLRPFNFGPAVKARKDTDAIIAGVIRERRSDMIKGDNGFTRNGGILDTMLEMQARQGAAGGPKHGEMEYDDTFIYDNIYLALFAGFDTTSSTLTRVLQFLDTDESKELSLKEKVIQELRGDVKADDDRTEGESTNVPSNSRDRAAGGVFRAFPLLAAVVLETNRVSPAVIGAFRKTTKPIEYNGFLVPKGETLWWSLCSGYESESFYPQHTKFCPFRFFQGGDHQCSASTSSNGAMSPGQEPGDQPIPQMFGFGKHMCPGKELAKLEIVLFLKYFLPKYKYRMVGRQKLQGYMSRDAPREGLRVVLTTTD